jgi:hypothetical protein
LRFKASPRQIVFETLSRKKSITKKKRLVEWLKVWALSSSPSTKKEKQQPKATTTRQILIGLKYHTSSYYTHQSHFPDG